MSDLMNALIAAKLMNGGGGGGGSGLPPISSETVVIMPEETLSFSPSSGYYYSPTDFAADNGAAYIVSWDGTDYTCTATAQAGMFVLGNMGIIGGPDTGEPFLITNAMGETEWMTTSTAATHLCGISQEAQTPPNKAILIVEDGEWETEPISKFASAALVTVTYTNTVSIGANAGVAIDHASYESIDGMPDSWDNAAGLWGTVYNANKSESNCYCSELSVLSDGTFSATIKNPTSTSVTFNDGLIIRAILVGM